MGCENWWKYLREHGSKDWDAAHLFRRCGKKAVLTTDGFTRGEPLYQIFQTPSSARRSQGVSGPRIGTDGTKGSRTSLTGHGGKHSSASSRQKNTGERIIESNACRASGSFFTSTQQEPSSFPSQSEQHFGFSVLTSWVASQPGRRTAFSIKHTRNGDADARTSKAMQSKRKVAVIRPITELQEPWFEDRRKVFLKRMMRMH